MEEALMAQAEAIRKTTTSVPRRGFDLLLCVCWTKLGLTAILLLWFLLAFCDGALVRGWAQGLSRNDLDQSAR